jgi:hypothetical protein
MTKPDRSWRAAIELNRLEEPARLGLDPHAGRGVDEANMRQNGVRSVEAICETCQHEAVVNRDAMPASLPVPDVALWLKYSACGSKQITTRPNWTERPRVV